MLYSLGDFRRNLEAHYNHDLRALDKVNIQSHGALEAINECLPRNMMVKKIFQEKEDTESILDVKKQ